MRITWVTRSFLDYRIPVFAALDELCGHQLTVIYGTTITPERVSEKLKSVLGERAIGLGGEKCIGDSCKEYNQLANKTITVPIQKGLIKEIRKSRPDVLVCDGFFQWTFYAMAYHLLHGTPIVMCYERTKHTETNCPWYRTLYRRIASHFFRRICCNGKLCIEYTHDVLKVPEKKLSVGHMAADVETMANYTVTDEQRQKIREAYGNPDVMLLFTGRMIPLKGVSYLLNAFQEAQASFDCSISLVLVGDGPELESYRKQSIPNVYFPGVCPYDQMASYYHAADVFIIPTLEDNWSLVVPEAMACGLPIASSIYNGCWPELVTKENGWTFDPLKKESICSALLDIVSRRDNLENMGQVSKSIVFQSHTPRHAAQNIYNNCLECVRKK